MNFGCGSSREHAPESLKQWGIKAIVGGSFAEIFFGNCTMLGIPCLSISQDDVLWLQRAVGRDPQQAVTVDVERQEVRFGDRVIPARIAGRRAQPARLRGVERHPRAAGRGRRDRGHRGAPAVRQGVLIRGSSGADRPHADPRDRLRGVGRGGGRAGRPPPRLPRRRARLGRSGSAAGRPRLPGPRALPARLRAHALPRPGSAPHGAAGRDRPGPAGLPGRARDRAGRARRLRLGRARRLHHRHPGARARARPGHHRRLQRPEHHRATSACLRAAGAGQLVPVVLQHRARDVSGSSRTAARSAACSGGTGRRAGASTTRRSSRRRPPSTTPTSSRW